MPPTKQVLEDRQTSWESEVCVEPAGKASLVQVGIVGPDVLPETMIGCVTVGVAVSVPVPTASQAALVGHATWARLTTEDNPATALLDAAQVAEEESGPDAAQPEVPAPTAAQVSAGVHATWFRVVIAAGRDTAFQVSPVERICPASTTGRPVLKVPQAAHAVDEGQITLVSEATLAGTVSAVTVLGVVVLSAMITPCGVVVVKP